jgi:D-alanyl-D-alanine carboxypeptidase
MGFFVGNVVPVLQERTPISLTVGDDVGRVDESLEGVVPDDPFIGVDAFWEQLHGDGVVVDGVGVVGKAAFAKKVTWVFFKSLIKMLSIFSQSSNNAFGCCYG